MAVYTDLPAEVRHRILRMLLPAENSLTQNWMQTYRPFVLINRQSLADMRQIAYTWSPIYTFRKPCSVQWPKVGSNSGTKCALPQPSKVCLSLFDTTSVDFIYDMAPLVGQPSTSSDLLDQWRGCLHSILRHGVRTLYLDLTPAPGPTRNRGLSELATIVTDRRVKDCLLLGHEDKILNIISDSLQLCSADVDIILTGTYGNSSRPWIREITRQCSARNIALRVDATFVPLPKTRKDPSPLSLLVRSVNSQIFRWGLLQERSTRACKKMRKTLWRQPTLDSFNECAKEGVWWCRAAIIQTFCFIAEIELETVDLSSGDLLQRRFVHHMAKDLHLWTETDGEEPKVFVRLCRTHRPESSDMS